MQFRQFFKKQLKAEKSPSKILIDCKGGFYDIQAILIALHMSKQYKKQVIGITCVAGGLQNTEGALLDALVACKIAGLKVPVYRGSSQSMLLRTESPDVQIQQAEKEAVKSLRQILTGQQIAECKNNEISGIQFLVECGKKYQSQLGIIALGPLTNLSIAYHLDYSFGNVTMLSIYGGQYTGVGNVKGQYSSEKNFMFDPTAAHLVIKNFVHNAYLSPLQFALEFKLEQENIKKLQQIFENKVSNKKQQYQLLFRNKNLKMPYGWGQILATMFVFNQQIVSKIYHCFCEVSLHKQHIQGFLCIDWLKSQAPLKQKQNTKIFAEFNQNEIVKDLSKVFQ